MKKKVRIVHTFDINGYYVVPADRDVFHHDELEWHVEEYEYEEE